MVRILHFRDKCIGCNACVEAAPERWRMSRHDGKSTLVGGTLKKGIQSVVVPLAELEENQKAAIHCPVNVIRIEVHVKSKAN